MQIELLKRKKFRKCMVGKGCRGRVVQGHLASRSWLEGIAETGQVYVFAPYSPGKIIVSEDVECAVPVKEHTNNALTRYFTCEEHEKLFFPIDTFDPDLSHQKNSHLLLYRSILAQLWLENLMVRCYRKLLEESPEDEFYRMLIRVHADNVLGLRHYKRETESCIEPNKCSRCLGGPCLTIGYEKYLIWGKPRVASYQFSAGNRVNARIHSKYELHLQPVANCAISVLPTKRGHTALIHYFLREKPIIQGELDHMAGLIGKKLEAYISGIMLSSCENIAVSPTLWEGLGKRRQDAIRDRFLNDMPDIGVGTLEMIENWTDRRLNSTGIEWIPNPNQINLFRESKL